MDFESKSDGVGQVTRRTFLVGCAAGSAVLATAQFATALPGSGQPALPISVDSALPFHLSHVFAPIGPGTVVYEGWTVFRVSVQGQAVAIELQNLANDYLRFDVCRRNPQEAAGITHTEFFELILMNNGAGNAITPAETERVARVLAAALKKNEMMLPLGATQLRTHRERVSLFESAQLHFRAPTSG